MASTDLAVIVKLDLGIAEPIFVAMADVLEAKTSVEKVIARGVFSALCEIQRMGDEARKSFGHNPDVHEFVFRVREEQEPRTP